MNSSFLYSFPLGISAVSRGGGGGSITPAGLVSFESDPIVAAMMRNYASYNLANPSQSSESVSLLFNGSTFSLMTNGIAVFSVSAVSGRPLDDGSFSYSISRQKEKGVGPLPAGNYSIRPNSIQWWTEQSSVQRTLAFLGLAGIKAGRWPGGMYSWGVARIDIFPEQSTVLYGRQGFTIHGGMSQGSAGCIDLTINDLIFFRLLEHYQYLDCIPLQVKY